MDDRRRIRGRTLLALLLVAAAVPLAPDVNAEDKVTLLANELTNSDFRVRTFAALTLGNTGDPKAVAPLCKCLADKTETETVRVACAAGLGKLKKPGSDGCLKDATGDKSKKVAEQAGASLKQLGGGAVAVATATAGSGCPDAPVVGTPKYYVGIDVNNKTTRPDGEIKTLVATELRCRLLGNDGRFRIADDIDPKKMLAVATKDKLEGYYLVMQVDPIKYAGGQLKVTLKLSIMTSNRELKSELTKWLALSGTTSPSKIEEDKLLRKAAEWLADKFAEQKQ